MQIFTKTVPVLGYESNHLCGNSYSVFIRELWAKRLQTSCIWLLTLTSQDHVDMTSSSHEYWRSPLWAGVAQTAFHPPGNGTINNENETYPLLFTQTCCETTSDRFFWNYHVIIERYLSHRSPNKYSLFWCFEMVICILRQCRNRNACPLLNFSVKWPLCSCPLCYRCLRVVW